MLRRIRIGFALLAVVLLLPLGVLVARSLEGLERERELQHASVANRVFDEAERELADFLRAEQARGVNDYRAPDPGDAASPLAVPAWSFVRGYFQVDARGRLTTPARSELAAELERWLRLDADDERRQAALERAPARAEAAAPGAVEPAPAESEGAQVEHDAAFLDSGGPRQAPGTTRNLQALELLTGREKRPASVPAPAPPAPLESYSSADALETLGRIAKRRARADLAEAPAKAARARALPEPLAAAAHLPETKTAGERPGIAPSRLSSERAGDTGLLLYRTALLPDGTPVRQGLLVDLPALGAWLEEQVLGDSALRDSLELAFGTLGSDGVRFVGADERTAALPQGRFVYAHRFGEPFEVLGARLAIAPLDDGGTARNLLWLAGLLIAASTLGLFALYRTAAVAVHFAERRSNFAAAVSHELKTPLTAIRMYAEMLRDGMVPDDARRREYYGTITAESERLTRLIDNVLEWSRLEKQPRELDTRVAPVTATVREVVRVLEPHARSLGFDLVLSAPDDLPAARHDPDALQQILFNALDNALKYARESRPARVEIDCTSDEAWVAIRVRDHGPGVERRDLALVFEPFYRAGRELSRATRGTGIGLALVRELARAMSAEVAVRNHPDGGLELELRLPRESPAGP